MGNLNYGISTLSIIPVRSEPSERSEMVTQILFGEHFQVYEKMMGWSKVQLSFDGYEGWVDTKMITPISARRFEKLEANPAAIVTDIFSIVPLDEQQTTMIAAGSSLPCWRPYKKQYSLSDSVELSMEGSFTYGQVKNARSFIIKQALRFFNAPYLWGGRTPMGVDCSGLVQSVYKMAGITLPRDASQQVDLGETLSFVEEAQPGDLAFFDNEEGKITHVGIIWEKNKIIHASGKVRIDNIDQFGIFNVDTQKYSHKLRVIKQVLEREE
ncbi:hypothetical protein EMN47_04295 [Prolixibacteraceae bacterium JC049]|nr:hypothetical protein [Prolixibacteraceae bacterium JC049]